MMTRSLKAAVAALFFCALPGAYAAEAYRDPFVFGGERAPGAAAGPAPAAGAAPVVEMILVSPEKRIAVIDGRRLTVGSSLAGGVITRIDINAVVVEKDGALKTLRLSDAEAAR